MNDAKYIRNYDCFCVSHFVIQIKNLDEPWQLKVFCDTHSDSHLHGKDNWQKWLHRASKLNRALFIGLGDYHDLHSYSERSAIANAKLHDASQFSIYDQYKVSVENYAQDISFMKGRLIGLVEGNHYGLFSNGQTTTEYLCELMNKGVAKEKTCPYLGAMAFMRLTFVYGKQRYDVDIYAHHGKGAARLLGGSLNRVQQLAEQANAHIYLMAHDHKIVSGLGTRIDLTRMPNGKLDVVAVEQIYLRSGGMMRGTIPNKPSYLASNAKGPLPLRLGTILMTPRLNDSERRGFHVELVPALGDVAE